MTTQSAKINVRVDVHDPRFGIIILHIIVCYAVNKLSFYEELRLKVGTKQYNNSTLLPPKQPLPLWTKKYSELLRCEPVYEDCLQILYNELLPDYLASMTPP